MPGMSGSIAADLSTLEGRLTATRAGYLDRLAIIAAGGAGELTAARAALLANLDATVTSRLASIKATGRGTLTIADPAATASATITAVNMAKTMLRWLGWSSSSYASHPVPRVDLVSSTTITATSNTAASGLTIVVSYEYTEFN